MASSPPTSDSTGVSPKTVKKFYEPIALLVALNQTFRHNAQRKIKTRSLGSDLDPEEVFQGFLNYLGQLCDSRPGGSTVTAFAILKLPEKIQYVFGSNKRSNIELETTKGYISSVLKRIGDAGLTHGTDSDDLKNQILRETFIFNLQRVKCYLGGLVKSLNSCISICNAEDSETARLLQTTLPELLQLAQNACEADLDIDDFVVSVNIAMKAIQDMRRSSSIEIRKRSSDESMNNTTPWLEFRHTSLRLLSYQEAVDALLEARQYWEILFQDFEVVCVDSSEPHENPLRANPLSAAEIASRMLSTEEKSKYADQILSLSHRMDLDETVRKCWTNRKYRPVVHAEVLVLNWLGYPSSPTPPPFFNNWQYIGSSKPTCRLCDHYFTASGTGVETGVKARNTHGNLYYSWRLPDLPGEVGHEREEAIKHHQEIMQSMTKLLKPEIFRIAKTGIPGTRFHDSSVSSYPPRVGPGSVTTVGVEVDEGSTRVGTPSLLDSSVSSTEDWSTVKGEGDDDSDSSGPGQNI